MPLVTEWRESEILILEVSLDAKVVLRSGGLTLSIWNFSLFFDHFAILVKGLDLCGWASAVKVIMFFN